MNSIRPYFLLSLHDKESYREWIQKLDERDQYRFVATEGTASWCQSQGVECRTIDQLVGLNPRLEGQVKTLHPDLYTGILAADRQELPEEIPYVRGIAVDLTPIRENQQFVRTNVDIGGISLLRAGVKNFENVVVVSNPGTARLLLEQRNPDRELHRRLARKALHTTLRYDKDLLGEYDEGVSDSEIARKLSAPRRRKLRYGENPDQSASLHADLFSLEETPFRHRAGDDLSYTNCLDLDAARRFTTGGDALEVAAVKHTNPTGWARGEDPRTVIREAWEGDPKSAFGGVVALNRRVTTSMLEQLGEWFVEAVVAPGFEPDAVAQIEGEKRPRLVQWQADWDHDPPEVVRSLSGSLLRQSLPSDPGATPDEEVVTRRAPGAEETTALHQSWRLCRWVTSNAAVVGTKNRMLGAGGGQQSRVDAVQIALDKYHQHHAGEGDPLVLASDGFFPFPDSVELAAENGVDAVIAPGGSIRDDEVVEAADDHDIAMLFTHRRAFYH